MRNSKLKVFLMCVTLTACGESANFSSRTDNLEIPETDDGDSNPLTSVKGDSLSLSIIDRSVQKNYDPVEMLFVLDNSRSMQDNINKLSNSMDNFLAKMGTSKVPYNARILTLDMLQGQLVDVATPSVKSPALLYGGPKPVYARGALDDLYKNATSVSSDSGYQNLKDALQAVKGNTLIDNEPGICLAMDYINWNMNTALPEVKKYGAKQKLHVVFLSDEDNAESFVTRNAAGSVVASKNLVCYQDRKITNKCTDIKYKIVRQNERYCPTYQEGLPVKRIKWTVSYNSYRNACKALGDNGANTSYNSLQFDRACVTNRFLCNDTQKPTEYSCSSPSLSSHISATNIAGSYKYCSTPDVYTCNVLVDGQIVPQDKTPAEALALSNLGLTCAAKGVPTKKFLSNAEAANFSGQCENISCNVTKYAQVYAEEKDLRPNYTNCAIENDKYTARNYFAVKKTGSTITGVDVASPTPRMLSTSPGHDAIANTNFCGQRTFPIPQCISVKTHFADISLAPAATWTGYGTLPQAGESNIQAAARVSGLSADIISSASYVEENSTTMLTRSAPCSTIKPAADDSLRSMPNYNEGYTFKDIEVDDPSGPLTRQVCNELVSEPRNMAPTPENAKAMVRELYPNMSVTWHSIVNQDGKSCGGLVESNVSAGTGYKRLSQISQGNVANICDDKFDNFIVDLSNSIIKEIELNYDIPKELQGRKLLRAYNHTTKREINLNREMSIDTESVHFEKAVVSKGDKVELVFDK